MILQKMRAPNIKVPRSCFRYSLDAIRDATCVFCANTAFAPGLNDLLANLLGDRFVGSNGGEGAMTATRMLAATTLGGDNGEVRGDEAEVLAQSTSTSPRMPHLRMVALTARLSSAAAAGANLRLVRVGAVSVSWHSAGTPLFIYRAGPEPAGTGMEGIAGMGVGGTGIAGTGVAGMGVGGIGVMHVIDPDTERMIEGMRAACGGLDGNAQFRALMRVSSFHSMVHDDLWRP